MTSVPDSIHCIGINVVVFLMSRSFKCPSCGEDVDPTSKQGVSP